MFCFADDGGKMELEKGRRFGPIEVRTEYRRVPPHKGAQKDKCGFIEDCNGFAFPKKFCDTHFAILGFRICNPDKFGGVEYEY